LSARIKSLLVVLSLCGIGARAADDRGASDMVFVPAGEFLMGSDAPDADPDEKPASKVFVDAFWIDRTEVTNDRYRLCVEAGACTRPASGEFDQPRLAELPLALASWEQALKYCAWVGKRLPTEAEWEKAARGTDGRTFPWGNEYDADKANILNLGGPTRATAHAAGASPFGAVDMAGNVWEWTSSLYKPYPYDSKDGREDMASHGGRVNRGGSFSFAPHLARTTFRATAGHMYRRFRDLGFRCARSEGGAAR
jgi:eukaryotic-like serine/threonine-protein kinase